MGEDEESPSLATVDAIVKDVYGPALRKQLNRPGLTAAMAPHLPLSRRRRAWLRVTRRPWAIGRRLAEAWGVLRRGLPESDW